MKRAGELRIAVLKAGGQEIRILQERWEYEISDCQPKDGSGVVWIDVPEWHVPIPRDESEVDLGAAIKKLFAAPDAAVRQWVSTQRAAPTELSSEAPRGQRKTSPKQRLKSRGK